LQAIDLTALPLPGAARRRVLLLERDGIEADADLVRALRDAGAQVARGPGDGYGARMTRPDAARPPSGVFEAVETWLGEVPCTAHVAVPGAAPTEPESAELPGMRETPILLRQPFGEMFGIIAEPDAAAADLCVVFLNAAAIRRVGPNRMWVDMARRWAARGVPTVRLDLEGIGDTDGDGSSYADVANLYVPAFVEQVRAALDALEARGLPSRFVLAGLCSGAYWAFQTALEDERVAAAFLLNSRVLFWREELETERDVRRLRRHFLRRSSWRRLWSGELWPGAGRLLELARWAVTGALHR